MTDRSTALSVVRKVAGSNPTGDLYFHFGFFHFLTIPHSSAKPIQMKSSMTFIQNKRCTERKII